MQRGVKIDHDIEKSPLQIRTNSEVGSSKQVKVWFYDAEGNYAGAVFLFFMSSPKYRLYSCSESLTNFPIDLPSDTDKVWTISLTRTSGERRVVINCNGKELVNVVLSNNVCDYSAWKTTWSNDIKKIWFDTSADTSSDYYRAG